MFSGATSFTSDLSQWNLVQRIETQVHLELFGGMFSGASCFDCSKAPSSWETTCAGDKGEPGTVCATTTFDIWALSSIRTHEAELAESKSTIDMRATTATVDTLEAELKSTIDTHESTIDTVKDELAESKSTIVALTAALAKVQATIDSIDDTCIDSSNRRRLSRCLDGESHTKLHTPNHAFCFYF